MEVVRKIWLDLLRPSADVLLRELRRQKIKVSEPAVRRFVNSHVSSQVLHPGPRSNGKIVAFHERSVFEADLLDQSARDPKMNEGYRYGLMVVDVYSRRVAGVLLKSKLPAETATAFQRACTVLGGFPKVLETDEGGEFHFPKLLAEHGTVHVQRDPRHTNGLAVVDSTIGRLRRAIAREQVESGTDNWTRPFRQVQDALNRRPLAHLLGARPVDVAGDPVLQFGLNFQSGQDQLTMTSQLHSQEDKLREAGAFRTLLPREKFQKTGKPRWSAEVHAAQGGLGRLRCGDRRRA